MQTSFLFNPDNDLALANNDANYLAPQSARLMGYDLALLPLWWASDSDSILIPHSDLLYYWQQQVDTRLPIPHVKWITACEPIPEQPIVPWGWNPALVKQLSLRGLPLSYLPDCNQMQRIRTLSSREWAAQILKQLRQTLSDLPLTGEAIPCYNETDTEHAIKLRNQTLLKAPWSCSGKGLRKGNGTYAPPLSGWCSHLLKTQGCVMVEPFYDKVEDFAMEFYIKEDGVVDFIGYSLFHTDVNGAYEGNHLMSNSAIENHLQQYLPPQTLKRVCQELTKIFNHSLSGIYQGYLGIDMMICRTASDEVIPGTFSLHPCVEINLRMNMGVVSCLWTDRYLAEGRKGKFFIDYLPSTQLMKERHHQLTRNHPLHLSTDGRVLSGYLNLTPIGKETHYVAWVLVDTN